MLEFAWEIQRKITLTKTGSQERRSSTNQREANEPYACNRRLRKVITKDIKDRHFHTAYYKLSISLPLFYSKGDLETTQWSWLISLF